MAISRQVAQDDIGLVPPDGHVAAIGREGHGLREAADVEVPRDAQTFDDRPEPGPAGLTLQRLRENSGYGDEVFFTGILPDGSDYAVRCMMPENESQSTSADCQRDIHIGRDLSVLYRFSSRLLPQWRAMEARVRDYLGRSFVENGRSVSTALKP